MNKNNLDFTALDDTPEALSAAAHNFKLLKNGWCKCTNKVESIVYYRCPQTGSHGWMCTDCRGIVQTG